MVVFAMGTWGTGERHKDTVLAVTGLRGAMVIRAMRDCGYGLPRTFTLGVKVNRVALPTERHGPEALHCFARVP